MTNPIIFIEDNEVADVVDTIKKYPIKNNNEWVLDTEDNNLLFLVTYLAEPIKDPWNRKMKNWTFDDNDTIGTRWIFPSGRMPTKLANNDFFDSMCYTTINKKIVKLWRTTNN